MKREWRPGDVAMVTAANRPTPWPAYFDGKPGTLVSFPGQYLGVRFDGEGHTSRCHPTWRVEREGVR